ncbi:unnamed protein product [Ceutorhynchus assimilis]|uniref:Double jelly roll-like domain-containing protein n=1 Tax=Ceutorhynchus assimilis TaxID=467358 RepID=A0A9N9MH43_9CUCU|nr:unnamed protein product [Ceutorhynchus assimilis]
MSITPQIERDGYKKMASPLKAFSRSGGLLKMASEQLGEMPKEVMIVCAPKEIALIWDKLPEALQNDVDILKYQYCGEHYNEEVWNNCDVADGPAPRGLFCCYCKTDDVKITTKNSTQSTERRGRRQSLNDLASDKTSRYGLALLGFHTYNSIFIVDESNNAFEYSKKDSAKISRLTIPPGAYEIVEIEHGIIAALRASSKDDDTNLFSLKANNNTLKCELKSKLNIDFGVSNSIGKMLGYESDQLESGNITSGAYLNSRECHTLFEFDIEVEPGYKITKEPQNNIYLPIKPEGRQFIDNITLRILDDNGHLIDFRGEKIIVKLELKKIVPKDPAKKCCLSNNALAFLFDEIRYEMGGEHVTVVRKPGITTALKTMVSFGASQLKHLLACGCGLAEDKQHLIDSTSHVFSGKLPLKYLMGFAEDYTKRIFNVKQEIILIIARTFANCYIGEVEGDITLDKIEWKIRHIIPIDNHKLKIMSRMNKGGQSINIQMAYRKWDLYELPTLHETSADIWTLRTSNSLERPRFLIIGFQKNENCDEKEKYATEFTTADVSDIRLYLNSSVYPYERWNLEFSKKLYAPAYYNLENFQSSYYGREMNEPMFDFAESRVNWVGVSLYLRCIRVWGGGIDIIILKRLTEKSFLSPSSSSSSWHNLKDLAETERNYDDRDFLPMMQDLRDMEDLQDEEDARSRVEPDSSNDWPEPVPKPEDCSGPADSTTG